MKQRIIISGNSALWNYGNEAIALTTNEIIKKALPEARIEYVAAEPSYDCPGLSDTGMKIFKRRPRYGFHRVLRKIVRKIPIIPYYKILEVNPRIYEGVACALSVGGDIYTPRPMGLILHRIFFEHVIMNRKAPLVLWGTTVGPFERGTMECEKVKNMLDKMALITPRETRTMEFLKSLGLLHKSKLFPDPAFVLEPDPFDIEPLLPKCKDDKILAVNMSPMINEYLENNNIVSLGTECVRKLLQETSLSIIFVPHVFGASPTNDYLIMNQIKNNLAEYKGRLSIVKEGLRARKTKYLVSQCDALVSARMHCAIGGLSACTPTICISYSEKSIGVLNDIYDNTEWVIKTLELSPDVLLAKVNNLLNNSVAIKEHLKESMPIIQDKVWKSGEAIKDLVES